MATQSYLDNLSLRSPGSGNGLFHSATLMLLDKENMTRQYIDDYLKEQRIESGNLLEITTMDLLIEFAKIGLGIACVIKEFVSRELAENTLVEIPLDFPIHKREIGFAFLDSRQQNHTLKTFIDFSFHSKKSII